MYRIKKRLALLLLFAFLSALFAAGCGGSPKLADSFDEDAVKQKAMEAVALINARDTDGLKAVCTDTLAAALTDELTAQIYEEIGAGGAFLEMGDMAALGTKGENGEDYAVVVALAKYESKTFTFTLSFDTGLKLGGLFYK